MVRSDRQFPTQRKSWADTIGIRTGVIGETIDGVLISEANRATVFEFYRDGIDTLRRMVRENYLRKNVKAVLVGLPTGNPALTHKYAIFVQSGFLRNVTEDETLVPRNRHQKKRKVLRNKGRSQTRQGGVFQKAIKGLTPPVKE